MHEVFLEDPRLLYVCMHVCMWVYVCMYVWMHVCMYGSLYVCMHVQVPIGLQSLFELIVPLGTNYKVIEPVPEMTTQVFQGLFAEIRGKRKLFLEHCLQSGHLRGPLQAQVTRDLVMWSELCSEICDMQHDIHKHELKRISKIEEEGEMLDEKEMVSVKVVTEDFQWHQLQKQAGEFSNVLWPARAVVVQHHKSMLLEKQLDEKKKSKDKDIEMAKSYDTDEEFVVHESGSRT